MKLLSQISLPRIGLGSAPSLEEDDRVLHLFRNRAELKKAYADAQDEIHRLRDRLRQQEGLTARVQDSLDALEARLGSAALAFPTLVHFQLRDLWACGRQLILQMVEDLSRVQDERERRQFLAEHNRGLFERRSRAEAALGAADLAMADVRGRLAVLRAARERADRWWHFFRRRDLDRRILAATAEQASAESMLAAARSDHAALMATETPDFPGLSVESRRAINLAAIAYGELLCARLAGSGVLVLARAAVHRLEPEDAPSDRAACLALIDEVARSRAHLQPRQNTAAEVKQRSDRLKSVARYRTAEDVVPLDDSLLAVAQLESGNPPPMVLRDDTWDLRKVLLR